MNASTEEPLIRCWSEGPVARIEFNRPRQRNAFNNELMHETLQAVAAFNADPDARVLVVSGAGPAFSAGFDLKASAERDMSSIDKVRAQMSLQFDFITQFWTSAKPTIAMVHGPCIAGAFELSLACDLTVAAEDARFGEPEVRFGTGAVAMLFPWVTGPKQAKELVLTGADGIEAHEALRMGLVNRVVAREALWEQTEKLALSIARAAETSVVKMKAALNRSYEVMGMREALAASLDIDVELNATPSYEKQEFARIRKELGLKAAIEWRDNRFKN